MANVPEVFLRLAGLNPDARYEITEGGGVYGDDELLHSGLPVRLRGGDFQCRFWHFRAVAEDTHSAKAAVRTNSNVGKGESEQ